MISFDLECTNNHRFEGIFRDYLAFDTQLTKEMIECPVCGDVKIKRLFTGCSIQPGGSGVSVPRPSGHSSQDGSPLQQVNNTPNIFQMIRIVREYVVNNFENVGKDFAERAKAIHYGIEEHKDIYGESTQEEIRELADEGIEVLPIPDLDKIEN